MCYPKIYLIISATFFSRLHNDQIWLTIEPLPPGKYHPRAALADLAKRLIFARQSNADLIFIRQPWQIRRTGSRSIIEPNEYYLIYRTVVSLLDQATYLGPVDLDDGVHCHAYDANGQSVLAMWIDQDVPGGKTYRLHLSGADTVTDVFGRSQKLPESGSAREISLGTLPVFVTSAETWLVEFRQGLHFEQSLLPSQASYHVQNLIIGNPRKEPISGLIRLMPPDGWVLRPSKIVFSLQPGEQQTIPLQIQSAPREPAGQKQVHAAVMIDAVRIVEFSTNLPLLLDLEDVDVRVDVLVEGGLLLIRHGITNRSGETLTFRSFAEVPGRKRQNLQIVNLKPQQSVIKTHVLDHAEEISGKTIRVGLRQYKGPRVHEIAVQAP